MAGCPSPSRRTRRRAARCDRRESARPPDGFHLVAASDETLAWAAGKPEESGVRNLMGASCTGIEALYRLRQLAGLSRETAIVGAVGASSMHGTGSTRPRRRGRRGVSQEDSV